MGLWDGMGISQVGQMGVQKKCGYDTLDLPKLCVKWLPKLGLTKKTSNWAEILYTQFRTIQVYTFKRGNGSQQMQFF